MEVQSLTKADDVNDDVINIFVYIGCSEVGSKNSPLNLNTVTTEYRGCLGVRHKSQNMQARC